MKNNNHRLRAIFLLLSGALIFGFGCASVPESRETPSAADINKTFVLPSPLNLSHTKEDGLIEKAQDEPVGVQHSRANTRPEGTAHKKPSVNQETNAIEQSILSYPQKDMSVAQDPSSSSIQKGSDDSSSISDALPDVPDGGELESPSVYEKNIESSEISDTSKTSKTATSDQKGKARSSHPSIRSTAATRTDDGDLVEDLPRSSTSLLTPLDSSRPLLPPDLLQPEDFSDELESKTAGSDSINSRLDESDPPINSILGATIPNDNLVTPPLIGPTLPELSTFSDDLIGPSSSVTDLDKEEIDSPPDPGSKSISFSKPSLRVSLSPENPSASIAFGNKQQSTNENLPGDGEGKVSFFGDKPSGLPPPHTAPVSEIRFLDSKNGVLKRSLVGAGKTLGFSNRRVNDRFLQRQVDPSVFQGKRVLQSSGKPQKYDSLRDFLESPSKLGPSGSAPSSSPRNYQEVEKFLETTESTRDLEYNQNTTPPVDGRYQNALQWLRSRGQGGKEPN
jgi:hypothetical protein